MTREELTAARKALGMNAADLGRALDLGDDNPGRLVRLWEAGTHRVPGPVGVALRFMLDAKTAEKRQETQDASIERAVGIALEAERTRRAQDGMPPVPRAMTELMQIPQIPKTRRRG